MPDISVLKIQYSSDTTAQINYLSSYLCTQESGLRSTLQIVFEPRTSICRTLSCIWFTRTSFLPLSTGYWLEFSPGNPFVFCDILDGYRRNGRFFSSVQRNRSFNIPAFIRTWYTPCFIAGHCHTTLRISLRQFIFLEGVALTFALGTPR